MGATEQIKEGFSHLKWTIILRILGIETLIALLPSGIVAWVRQRIGVAQLPISFYVVLGILVLCAIVLSTILAFVVTAFVDRLNAVPPAPHLAPVTPGNNSAELAISKPVDLKGKFDEMFFFRPFTGMETLFSYPYSVLFKLTITNVGTDETTIVDWNLGLWMGSDFLAGKIAKIPSSWRIRRYGTDLFNLKSFHDEPLEEKIDKLPSGEAFRKGIPRTGWIAFEVQAWQGELPHNAYFRIVAKDSFGNEHNFDRPAQNYLKTGDLVAVEQPLLESGPTG